MIPPLFIFNLHKMNKFITTSCICLLLKEGQDSRYLFIVNGRGWSIYLSIYLSTNLSLDARSISNHDHDVVCVGWAFLGALSGVWYIV